MAPKDSDELATSYARFSTEHQNSVDDQHRMNTETAEDNGLRIVDSGWFQDAGVSRSIADRKDLLAILAYHRANPQVRNLIVTQTDRLIGDLGQHMHVYEELGGMGVKLWDDSGWLDFEDPDVMTALEQKSLDSSKEVRRGRARTRKGLRAKVKSGVYASVPPFGLRMKPLIGADGNEVPAGQTLLDEKGRIVRSGVLDEDPTEYDGVPAIDWYRRMMQWIADGVDGGVICQRLVDHGVLTGSGNAKWEMRAVTAIARNRVYLGEQTFGRNKVVHAGYGRAKKGEVPRNPSDPAIVRRQHSLGAVIEADLWVRANAVLDARRGAGQRSKRSTGRKYPPRVFDGLVFCARCLMMMATSRDTKILATGLQAETRRYRCNGRQKGVGSTQGRTRKGTVREYCPGAHSISEINLVDALTGVLSEPGLVDFVYASPQPADDTRVRAEAHKKIRQSEEAISRIRDDYEEGAYDKAERNRRMIRWDDQTTAARSELAALDTAATLAEKAVPQTVQVAVVEAMKLRLANALDPMKDETDEHITQVRMMMHADVASLISRIEVDAPRVRIVLSPTAA